MTKEGPATAVGKPTRLTHTAEATPPATVRFSATARLVIMLEFEHMSAYDGPLLPASGAEMGC